MHFTQPLWVFYVVALASLTSGILGRRQRDKKGASPRHDLLAQLACISLGVHLGQESAVAFLQETFHGAHSR